MSDPAFLFYSSDFLTGVSDLTMEERGQYITLLCLQHQKGRLSEKTIRLCLGLGSVSEIADVISKFLKDEKGFYYNLRLEKEIHARSNFVNSRKNNGKLGGRPRKSDLKEKTDRFQVGLATRNLAVNENVNENVNVNENDNGFKEPDNEAYGKSKYGEFMNVLLWAGEHDKLMEVMGEIDANDYIERLGAYIASTGKCYKSHYATILNWRRKDNSSASAGGRQFKTADEKTKDAIWEYYDTMKNRENIIDGEVL